MKTGERIALLRKERGMSQQELADRLGVSRQSISKWELDDSIPSIENFVRLGDLFDTSIDSLVCGNSKGGNPVEHISPAQEHTISGKHLGIWHTVQQVLFTLCAVISLVIAGMHLALTIDKWNAEWPVPIERLEQDDNIDLSQAVQFSPTIVIP